MNINRFVWQSLNKSERMFRKLQNEGKKIKLETIRRKLRYFYDDFI